MVIWITGISGSGKTSLSQALLLLLKPRIPELVVLDGDAVRAAFGNDLGYSEEERIQQITRIQGIAKLLSDQNMVVLVAALYANPRLLAWNRQNIPDYVEVYLQASLDTVRARDHKGLYAANLNHMVGIDIPWHAPEHADIVIDMDISNSPIELAQHLIQRIPGLTRQGT